MTAFQHPPNGPSNFEYRERKSNGLGIAGFVVSLVGFLGGCFGGVVLCPIGLVLSGIAIRREPRGFAIAGLVLGILGSLWLVVMLVVMGGVGAGAFAIAREMGSAIKVQHNAEQFYSANQRLPVDLKELAAKYPDTPLTDRKGSPLGYRIDSPTRFTIILAGSDTVLGTADDMDLDHEVGGGSVPGSGNPTPNPAPVPVPPPP